MLPTVRGGDRAAADSSIDTIATAEHGPDRQIVGVDISGGALALARSLAPSPNLTFLECDVIQAPPAGAR